MLEPTYQSRRPEDAGQARFARVTPLNAEETNRLLAAAIIQFLHLGIVRFMCRYLDPIPVEFGPHVGDWLLIAVTLIIGLVTAFVTLLGVAASSWVALAAWKTSKSAIEIAESGNSLQQKIHKERLDIEYATRLDDSLANLFRAIRLHYGPLRSWLNAAEEVEIRNRTNPYTGELDYPQDPPMDAVQAEIEVVMLIARGSDAIVTADIRDTLARIESLDPNPKWIEMLKVMRNARLWRTREMNDAEVREELKGIQDRIVT